MPDPIKSFRNYLDSLFGIEDPLLTSCREYLAICQFPSMSVHPRLGKLLALLVRLSRARRALELGTLGGISAIYIARALPQEGYLLTIEKGIEAAQVAQRNFELTAVSGKIELALGDPLEILSTLTVPSFDLVFLDAEKACCPAYLELVLPLLRTGALIIAGTIFHKNAPFSISDDITPLELEDFNQRLFQDPRLESLIIPDIRACEWSDLDGIALAMVR